MNLFLYVYTLYRYRDRYDTHRYVYWCRCAMCTPDQHYCTKIIPYTVYSIGLPFSKIMPKTLHRSKSKIRLPPLFFFSSFVCLYTNKYNILCVFYMILFVHFYIKKYNSVPLYFIASKFNKMSKLKKDIKYNGTLLYFLM